MNCLIVDDEEMSRDVIRKCAERTDFLNVVGVCESAIEAKKIVEKTPVDVIFLDIEMPEMSGMDLLRNFPEIPQVVFISSKSEYAAEAFDYDVTDYIVKPVDYARFLKAAEKSREISENIQKQGADHVFIKKDSRLVRVDFKDIHWVEALADYVNIYTPSERHTVLSTMKSIEAKLPSNEFMRIHRSYIVRLDQIKEIEDNTVVLNDKAIPISRSKKEEFISKMNTL